MPPCAGCLLPGSAGDNGADVVLLGLWEPDVPPIYFSKPHVQQNLVLLYPLNLFK
jgi:hypothetical protein